MNKTYGISFLKPRAHWNWVSVSTIDKETFQGFIDYLYDLDRDIEVLPYIPGGLSAGMIAKPNMDKTYLVERIVKRIKNKESREMMFREFTFVSDPEDNEADIHFVEDVYEMLLSFGLTQEDATELANRQYYSDDIKRDIPIRVDSEQLEQFIEQFHNSCYFPYHSRWMFIYMFRGEFIRYITSKGYDGVSVEGGWVLNDKEREIKLGIIDENGNLIER